MDVHTYPTIINVIERTAIGLHTILQDTVQLCTNVETKPARSLS